MPNKLDKTPPPGAIRAITERHMSDEWRQRRDEIRDGISATVQKIEVAKQAGERVLSGFGVEAYLMGTSAGGRVKTTVEEPGTLGLHLGVREGKIQEASRVIPAEDGVVISYVRMPNFEPGHSREVGEHVVLGGTAYEVGRKEFLPEGGTTEMSVVIGADGMVRQHGWSGEASRSGGVYDAARLTELHEWAQGVMAEITG